MTTTDKLTADVEEAFRRHIEANPWAADLIKRMAFEIVPMTHRRASQAAPAPQDQFVTTLPQEAFDAFAKACDEAPAPSDGLREAAFDEGTLRDLWLSGNCRMSFDSFKSSIRAALAPAPAQEGDE